MTMITQSARLLTISLLFVGLTACGDDGGTAAATSDANNAPNNAENNTPNNTENNAENNAPGDEDLSTDPALCADLDDTIAPSARAEVMGVYDPRRRQLFFFGGDDGAPIQCSPNPNPIGDLWAFDAVCGTFRQIETAGGPGPRARGAAALDTTRDRMLVFGGRFREGARGGPYTLYNEVWALNLADETWELLETQGPAPDPRVNTAAVYHPGRDELIVYGGNTSNNGAFFEPVGDVWRLNMETLTWSLLGTSQVRPAARLFHAAALDVDNDLLYVYGGGDENAFFGPFFGDLWTLNVQTGVWTELYAGGAPGPEAPAHRFWPAIALDKVGNRIILFAGHDDGAVGNQNDTWAWDIATNRWIQIIPPETVNQPANGFCDFPADFVVPNADAPDRRAAQVAAVDPVRGEWIVYGGKTDCGIIDDVWTFDFQREAWLNLRPSTTGESCLRGENPDQCLAMCQ